MWINFYRTEDEQGAPQIQVQLEGEMRGDRVHEQYAQLAQAIARDVARRMAEQGELVEPPPHVVTPSAWIEVFPSNMAHVISSRDSVGQFSEPTNRVAVFLKVPHYNYLGVMATPEVRVASVTFSLVEQVLQRTAYPVDPDEAPATGEMAKPNLPGGEITEHF